MAVESKARRVPKAPPAPDGPPAEGVAAVRPAQDASASPEVTPATLPAGSPLTSPVRTLASDTPTQTPADDARPVSAPYSPPAGPPEARRVMSMNIPESLKDWVEDFTADQVGKYKRLDRGKVHELLLLHGTGDEGVNAVKTFIEKYYERRRTFG